jgi:hypothetical protein
MAYIDLNYHNTMIDGRITLGKYAHLLENHTRSLEVYGNVEKVNRPRMNRMLEKIRDNVARTPSIVLFKKPIRNITW